MALRAVDVFLALRTGAVAIATVSIAESMLTFLNTSSFGPAIGVIASVASRMGERDPDQAAAQTCNPCGWSAPRPSHGVVRHPVRRALLAALSAFPEVVSGVPNTRVMLGSPVIIVPLFVIGAPLCGAGDAVSSMRSLSRANACNLVLVSVLCLWLRPPAGSWIAMRIILFAQQPFWGMSHAAGALVDQSLGPGNAHRAGCVAWHASLQILRPEGVFIAITLGYCALG